MAPSLTGSEVIVSSALALWNCAGLRNPPESRTFIRYSGSSGELAVNGDKVTLGKTLFACIACSASLLGPLDGSAVAKTLKGCTEPKIGTSEVPLFSPPLINVVVGVGRVQF